jgi:hypothetical protein
MAVRPDGQFAAGTESKTVFTCCPITIWNSSNLNQARGRTRSHLSFLNRTVLIKGKNLRELGLALQDRGVEFIKPMAERYSSLAAGKMVWVKTIEIQEQKENAHA